MNKQIFLFSTDDGDKHLIHSTETHDMILLLSMVDGMNQQQQRKPLSSLSTLSFCCCIENSFKGCD